MNNSYFAVEKSTLVPDEPFKNDEALRERESKLVGIIDAIQGISSTREWSSLKEEVFDSLSERLTKELLAEAKKDTPDTLKLARISGQLIWSGKYSDLSRLENDFRIELNSIRLKLHGKT